jgi:hypothetical protein
MATLQARGIRVPEHVAMVGIGDHFHARATTPQMTTVEMPMYTAARRMMTLLLSELRGEKVPERELLPCPLIVRRSCGCAFGFTAALETRGGGGSRKPLAAVIRSRRAEIVEQMRRATGTADAEAELLGPVVDGFAAAMAGESQRAFLDPIEDALHRAAAIGGDLLAWQMAVSALRHCLLPHLAGDELVLAEDLWGASACVGGGDCGTPGCAAGVADGATGAGHGADQPDAAFHRRL